MSNWILSCPNCHKVFIYSGMKVGQTSVPYDQLWPTKPEFPIGGLTLDCPNCQKSETYQRFELMYRLDQSEHNPQV